MRLGFALLGLFPPWVYSLLQNHLLGTELWPPNVYVEILTPNVIVFGDSAFKLVIKVK